MIKISQQQEKFAQEIIKDKNQTEAYLVAYPTSKKWAKEILYSKASHLAAADKVKARIAELRKPIVEESQRTLRTILEEINKIKEDSLAEDKKLALDCLKHEAKLRGFEVDKSDITSNGHTVSMPTITRNGKPIPIKMGDK